MFRTSLFIVLMSLTALSQAQMLRGFLNAQEFHLPASPLVVLSSQNMLIVKYSEEQGQRYIGISDAMADGFFDDAGCSPLQLLEQVFKNKGEPCSAEMVHAMSYFYVDGVPHGTQQIDGTRFYHSQSDGKSYVFAYVNDRVFFIDSDYLLPPALMDLVVLPGS